MQKVLAPGHCSASSLTCQRTVVRADAYDGDMTEAPPGYESRRTAQRLSIAKVERALLCDLFEEVGPRHLTLCEGWTTHHLAAHLKIREGGPVDFVRNALPGDKAVDAAVESESYSDLVEHVRRGPAMLSLFAVPKAGDLLNTLEFFIHHEDVRRGEGTWEPRDLPTWVQDQIWGQVVTTAKLSMLRSPRQLTLRRTDTGDEERVSKGSGSRVIAGAPGEVALYVSGRKAAALVDRSG
jgi:uncharacterized protein (TIGR03085 family)